MFGFPDLQVVRFKNMGTGTGFYWHPGPLQFMQKAGQVYIRHKIGGVASFTATFGPSNEPVPPN